MSQGIVRDTRENLGMSMKQFAADLGVSVNSVSTMERRAEREDIKVSTLRKALNAMGYDMQITLVPLASENTSG